MKFCILINPQDLLNTQESLSVVFIYRKFIELLSNVGYVYSIIQKYIIDSPWFLLLK